MATSNAYPKLAAPTADGELLLWPEPHEMLRQTWENHRQLREQAEVKLAGVPLGRLRGWLRRWIGHHEDGRPIIANGHQTELYHPGVWVKNVVVDAAARRIGGVAVHFAVDTDAPKHLQYKWPGAAQVLTDDPAVLSARWSALVQGPSPGHVETMKRQVNAAAAAWGYSPAWDEFFGSLGEMAGKGGDLSTVLTSAHLAADRALGLRHQALVVSPLWRTTAYLVFVYDICSRAGEYAANYNSALAEFRRSHGILSPGRPMPDLAADGNSCEVPFWLDNLTDGSRKRADLVYQDGRWTLVGQERDFAFEASCKEGWSAAEQLGKWLDDHKLRLSPRALTLTTFLRVLVVDQFVHGIGGGLYDQVTDRLIAACYSIRPPAFAVSTATLYFPTAAGRGRVDLGPLIREGRRLRQDVLGERKRELARQIAQSPRGSGERMTLFMQMHRDLDQARQGNVLLEDWQRRFDEATRELQLDGQVFDRELPYTLQSKSRLEALMGRVNDRVGL